MKRKFFFVFASAMATSTLFMSCQKDLKPSKDTVLRSTPLPTTGTYCRIESMDVTDSWDPAPYGLSFHYDDFENPIAVEPSHPIMFVRPSRYFHYDHWHRLREYQVYAGSSGPVRIYNEWHLYGYDLDGRIGEDTAYFDATSVEDLATHTYGGISHL